MTNDLLEMKRTEPHPPLLKNEVGKTDKQSDAALSHHLDAIAPLAKQTSAPETRARTKIADSYRQRKGKKIRNPIWWTTPVLSNPRAKLFLHVANRV